MFGTLHVESLDSSVSTDHMLTSFGLVEVYLIDSLKMISHLVEVLNHILVKLVLRSHQSFRPVPTLKLLGDYVEK